ncbi:MAG: hypothetical protein K9L59_19835, partial [Desulfobacterales bacterium]|nr:hypothetical protein [Desulfobacterales bacterium]
MIKYETYAEAPDGGGTRSVASVLPAMTQYRPRRSVALQPPKPKAGAGRLLSPASVEVSHKRRRWPAAPTSLIKNETFPEASADVVNGLRLSRRSCGATKTDAVHEGTTPDFASGYARAGAGRALQKPRLRAKFHISAAADLMAISLIKGETILYNILIFSHFPCYFSLLAQRKVTKRKGALRP